MANLVTLAKKGVEYGATLGADQVEVLIVNEKQIHMEIRKSSLKGGDILEVGGAGVRIYIGKSLGLASTTRFKEINDAVKKAYALAKGSPEDPYFKSLPSSGKYRTVRGLYDKELAAVTFESLAKNMMEGIKEASLSKDYTVSGGLTKSIREQVIVNSLGVEARTRGAAISGSIGVKYEKGTDTSLGYEPINGRKLKDFNPISTGKIAAEKAKSRIGAKKISSAVMDVILDHKSTLGSLASFINSGTNGLSVALGTAFFTGKIGEKVAAKGITIKDDPFVASGMASQSFDDEGSPSIKLPLIEKGVLKNYLTDSYSANRLGAKNNGHGTRVSFISKPSPSISNLIISPGRWNTDEIIKETKKGILIEDSALTLQGASTNISRMVDNGYYIENGKIIHPIKNTMVGLTVFDAFININAISKEIEELWGSKTPNIRITKAKISSGQ
ncbi:TldD/PmbA family protein [Candidatus Bathyarchaeota archaeon]|nr:TldD/PmbA family protein [Candidatus Bathyarchaeota archaeon]